MIDGIKIVARLDNYEVWRKETDISFTVATDHETGEIRGHSSKKSPDRFTYIHSGKFETYNLTVKETDTFKGSRQSGKSYVLLIEGSLHKNFFGGKNYERFYYNDLREELYKLRSKLCLRLDDCFIQNIEFGVNIEVPFGVEEYINRSVLLHCTQRFNEYKPDRNGFVLGRHARHSQHEVKCYDKGGQNSLNYPLMRFEERVTRMQYLIRKGCQIRTLKDFTDFKKVSALGELLLRAWDNVLIFEPGIKEDKNLFTPAQMKLIRDGQYRDYWMNLLKNDRKKFNRKRETFRKLMVKHSQVNTNSIIRKLIHEEWELLMSREKEMK